MRISLFGGVWLLLFSPVLLSACSSGGTEAFRVQQDSLTQTLLVTGRLSPPRQVSLGAMIQSTVVEVVAEDGDLVEADTLLARLADDEAVAGVKEAEARVDEARSRLRSVTGVGRRVANERLTQARSAAEQAEKDFERAQQLYTTKVISEADFEIARRRRDTTSSQRSAAEVEASATGRGGADSASAAAALARAQAGLDLARTQLERTHIRTPITARVLTSDLQVGEVVRPGDVLFELASDETLEVRITPDELHLRRLAVGQSAKVLADAFPTRPIQAEIVRIAPQVDAKRGTVEVRLKITDELGELALKPDMTVTVEVLLGNEDNAVVLPTRGVRGLGSPSPYVLVAEAGTATRRGVETGLENEELVQITGGLSAGDVVLSASTAIAEGEAVTPRIVEF